LQEYAVAVKVSSDAKPPNSWLTFGLSGAQEQRYRNFYLPADLAQARICVLLILIPIAGFLLNDYRFFGYSWPFYALAAWRLGLLVFTIWLLNFMKRVTNYRSYDRAEFIWGLLCVFSVVGISATRPGSYVGHAILAVVTVFICLVIMPNRFPYQIIFGTTVAVGEGVVVAFRSPFVVTLTVTLSLLLAYAGALVTSWYLHAWRRRAFVAAEKEQAALEAVRENREWFRVTLSSIGDAVLAADTSGRVTFLNPLAASLTGWNTVEAQGQPSQDVFPIINEQTRVPAEDVVARVLQEGRVVELDNHTALISRDGSEIPIEDSAAPILDSTGKLVGVVVVFHDVTEKRRAQEALRLSEEKFGKAFAGNPAAIALTRLEDGLVLDINDTWVALSGYSREEAIGHSGRKLNIWPTPEAAARFVKELREKGSLRGWEQEFLKKSGEVFVAELSAQILVVGGEKLILSTVVDMTARKRAEAALVRAEKLAAVGRMAATVAHEINNPLAAVMNSIYIALLDTALDETTRQHLRTAEQELVRVANLTRQTLAFYRDHSVAESTSVGDLLEEVLRTYEHKLRNKHVQVTKEIAVQINVTTMVGELRQALSNIVANSIDALPDGGRLSIRAHGTSVDGLQRRLMITMADNGAGIAPELRECIFDPFFTTKAEIGTGLGLWVTRELLRKNGGSIRMRSRPGVGTAFTIFLPMPAAPRDSCTLISSSPEIPKAS
jgi:PAS domain S-box-containing protein